MDTCGKRFDTYSVNTTAVFEELSILAEFPTPVVETDLEADDSAVFPVALNPSIMPLEPESYSYNVISEGRLTYFNFTLNDFDEELYSFAVWGRVYATDGQEADPPIEDSTTDQGTPTGSTQDPSDPGAAYSHLLSGILLIPVLTLVLRAL